LLANDADLPNLREGTSGAQDVLNFFEYMSHLIDSKVLQRVTVWNKFSWWIEGYWAMYEPWIEEKRKEWPTLYSDFETLKSHMVRLDVEMEIGNAAEFSKVENLRKFVEYEVMDTRGKEHSPTEERAKSEVQHSHGPDGTGSPAR
jgi:hypothetical protein